MGTVLAAPAEGARAEGSSPENSVPCLTRAALPILALGGFWEGDYSQAGQGAGGACKAVSTQGCAWGGGVSHLFLQLPLIEQGHQGASEQLPTPHPGTFPRNIRSAALVQGAAFS